MIPTVQYGNIQPSIEIEAETYEEAQSYAMPKIEALWAEYADKPLTKTTGARKKIECFVGGTVFFDDATHTYTNEAGEVYLSGSQYAKQFEKPFDAQRIAEAMAKRDNKSKEGVLKMWELNNKASTEFGSAIHSALEAFGKYGSVSKQPYLKNVVESFVSVHNGAAEFEAFVVDHDKKHAGQIDRLEILGDKRCRVTDYKTNAEIEKSLPMYFKQLQFYTDILVANGWVAEPPVIYWWNGKSWETITKEEKK